jgi:hypothetical protein
MVVSEFLTQAATIGFSTSVSVVMTYTGLRGVSAGGSFDRASHTSCVTAVESLPPLYPITQGVWSDRYSSCISAMASEMAPVKPRLEKKDGFAVVAVVTSSPLHRYAEFHFLDGFLKTK